MTQCIVIYGVPKSGKTYASEYLEKNLKIKLIHYDFVSSIITECIRLVFENTKIENSFIFSTKAVFVDKQERLKFVQDIMKLIRSNLEYFEPIYLESIKGWANHGQYKQNKKLKRVKLSYVGMQMRDFADKIIQVIKDDIVKDSKFFIIEGRLFKNKKYRNALKKLFKNVYELECFNDLENNREYVYKAKIYQSLQSVKDEITKDLKFE